MIKKKKNKEEKNKDNINGQKKEKNKGEQNKEKEDTRKNRSQVGPAAIGGALESLKPQPPGFAERNPFRLVPISPPP